MASTPSPGTAAAITSELDALVFTPNTFSATTTFTLTDTTSLGTSKSDANTTVTVTNGDASRRVRVEVPGRSVDARQDLGGFDILDGAPSITANLDQLNDEHIDEIVISNNGNVVASVQQLTTDAKAINKLQNANLSPVRLAINDTAADVQAGLSTLVQDTGEIASITASDGPISSVSAATFLADQSALDKIVGGVRRLGYGGQSGPRSARRSEHLCDHDFGQRADQRFGCAAHDRCDGDRQPAECERVPRAARNQ